MRNALDILSSLMGGCMTYVVVGVQGVQQISVQCNTVILWRRYDGYNRA